MSAGVDPLAEANRRAEWTDKAACCRNFNGRKAVVRAVLDGGTPTLIAEVGEKWDRQDGGVPMVVRPTTHRQTFDTLDELKEVFVAVVGRHGLEKPSAEVPA